MRNGIGSEIYNYGYPPTAYSMEAQFVLDFSKRHSLLSFLVFGSYFP